jgi:hypothetical protein
VRRLHCIGVGFAVLGSLAFAQQDARSRLKPITAPIRHAGVYHVATGTWTRGASLANVVGPDVIYNNTCSAFYFIRMSCNERYEHRDRIPSTSSPTSDSVYYGTTNSAHRYDSRPGCRDEYTIDGFQVGYCSSHAGTVDWEYRFASSYSACGAADLVSQYTITVTGLPGGSATGAQRCWTIDIDVSGLPGGGFALSADGDGVYDGGAGDTFGWSLKAVNSILLDSTGPLIAGNVDWTGGGPFGVHTPCTGTDGTVWDVPVDLSEAGTGMTSSNFFRATAGTSCIDYQPGCYYFGGNPHADFFLKLYSDTQCFQQPPLTTFCAPGVGGIVTCPCGNPQVPAGATKGCDNFVSGGTGGAELSGAGNPSIVSDSLVLYASAEAPSTTVTVLFQGTTNTANTRTGAGVRCVGGVLKRLFKADANIGGLQFPNTAVSIHDASASKGFTITPPVTLYYYCAYRNSAANGHPGCPGLSFGFNATNAGSVAWTP